jgi:hypothetical protein
MTPQGRPSKTAAEEEEDRQALEDLEVLSTLAFVSHTPHWPYSESRLLEDAMSQLAPQELQPAPGLALHSTCASPPRS